jgi:hypothetical protein
MLTIKDMTQLGKLVVLHHGWAAAKAFKAYQMDEADRAVLARCALDLLGLFPAGLFPANSQPAGLMSAALAVALERKLSAPVQLVEGMLAVEGVVVLTAHRWVMMGGVIVDLALFRIAYAEGAPALLTKYIDLNFGPDKGLFVAPWKKQGSAGLTYAPRAVLPEGEVTALMGEAFALIKQPKAPE